MPIPGPPPGYSASILLDDGTGTFPFDVSVYVRMVSGFNWNRGRGDELSQNQPGVLTITLDNTDGRFTVGSATYNVACDQQIRVVFAPGTPSQRIRWTGAVQSWPVSWPTGDSGFAVVTAAATDPMATLSRTDLDAALAEEILADARAGNVALYYRLNEQDTALRGYDTLALGGALARVGGATAKPVFGQQTGATDGSNGVQLTGGSLSSSYLNGDGRFTSTVGGGGLHCELVIVSTAAISAQVQFPGLSSSYFGMLTAGGQLLVEPDGLILGSGLDDGLAHIASVEVDSTGLDVYLDGVRVYHDTAARSGTWDTGLKDPWLGATGILAGFQNSTAGTTILAHLNIGKRLSAARVLAHHAAFLENTGETVAARVTRVAALAGVTTGSLSTAGTTALGPTLQAGRNALDVIQEAADADLGSAYVDGSGLIDYISGTDLGSKVTPALTIDASWIGEDTEFPVDMQSVVNYATGQASSNGQVYIVQDSVSISGDSTHRPHGRYPADYTWNVNSDAQAQARTQWKIGVYSQPLPRCPTLKLDLLTMYDLSLRDQATALDLGSYIRITGLPSQTPGGTTADLIVEGIKETVSLTEWSIELNCAQRSLWNAFIPDDLVHGIPDSALALAYV